MLTKDQMLAAITQKIAKTKAIAVSGLADNIWNNPKLLHGAEVIRNTIHKAQDVFANQQPIGLGINTEEAQLSWNKVMQFLGKDAPKTPEEAAKQGMVMVGTKPVDITGISALEDVGKNVAKEVIPVVKKVGGDIIEGAKNVVADVYHGTKAKIVSLAEANILEYGSASALYGPGLYLTDNEAVAAGYAATKGEGPTGTVLKGRLKPDIKLLNLDEKLPDAVAKAMEKRAEIINNIYGVGAGKPPTFKGKRGTEATREFMHLLQDFELLKWEGADEMRLLQEEIEKLGYDGYRHIGGQITKGQPSNISILFDTEFGRRASSKLEALATIPFLMNNDKKKKKE